MMSRDKIEKNCLNKDEGEFMLAILVKSIKPIFSGSVDHRINMINVVKAKKLLRDAVQTSTLSNDELSITKDAIELYR
jgi:hypothetical protein